MGVLGHADFFRRTIMRKQTILGALGLLSAALFMGGCEAMGDHAHHADMWASLKKAVAVLEPTGTNNVHGTITFEDMGNHVHVSGSVTGLAPNSVHGFHIHQFGDISSTDGSSAGPHYNPGGTAHQHGDLNAANAHAGDFGNITADASGTAKVDLMVHSISIAGVKNPIIGRAIVVHANRDDFTQSPPSATPGNSGARIAVGVIGIAK
jgi:Cu-Zn family superoxide dismutase